jgi:hypothetical protein
MPLKLFEDPDLNVAGNRSAWLTRGIPNESG